MKKLILVLLLFVIALPISAQDYPKILSMKERAEVIDDLLKDKVKSVLPELMERTGIDMWVIVSREYNEDPVIETFLPATWHAARRRTILVMHNQGDGTVETLAVARYDVGDMFKKAWNPEEEPDQWKRLAEVIEERDPKKIGINISEIWGHADGLVVTDHEEMKEAIGRKYTNRLVSAEKLAVGWLETRTPREMQIYPQIVRIAHEIIAEGFSDNVIQPGVTTTDDVVWWFRQKIRDLNLITWFHPSVSIQRADPESFDHLRTFDSRPEENVILPGDLIHVDFGIKYLRLNTDTQQHAYILKPGETDVPEYLIKAFDNANRLQDIFTNNFREGRTGNEVLAMSRQQAIDEGLKPSIYTHPLGYHGHAAGTTLGMWDAQDGVPGDGDYPLQLNTAYSIELNNATQIEEWGKEIRIMLEEDAFFDSTGVWYIDGRQKEIMTIPRIPAKQ
ncbi:MAG: M24 family metallopeptidase [Gracilimonas sp.]|nr:M24 family metallopeptidase [Gracilimonas sp.]